jgi:hypothetical protein
MRDIFILNEIWVQGKIYSFISTLLGRNILLIASQRRWLRTTSSIFCHQLKLEKNVIHYLNFMSNMFI